jgi:hypothetical protein
MGAMITREQARERLLKQCQEIVERRIPLDPNKPVRGEKFREWEDQADEVCREIGGAFLETLSQLNSQAHADTPGTCPYCGSDSARFLEAAVQQERQSTHGPVVLPRQVARCRSCGRTFSPSGAGVGDGCGSAADAQGGRTCGA